MAPDAKYYDRAGKGNAKFNLGHDNEDISINVKHEGPKDKTLPIPTERTCDKPVNQDGNTGKPWASTLAARR